MSARPLIGCPSDAARKRHIRAGREPCPICWPDTPDHRPIRRRPRRPTVPAGSQPGLAGLRRGRGMTQDQLADAMAVYQSSISRFELQADHHVSSLARYVEGLGGRLVLAADFGGDPPVVVEFEIRPTPPRKGAP